MVDICPENETFISRKRGVSVKYGEIDDNERENE